ncbi:MAG: hypothetical protein RIS64_738 [Bacteroidota bacterium]|jgi:hypothetical protein
MQKYKILIDKKKKIKILVHQKFNELAQTIR